MNALLRFHAAGVGLALPTAMVAAVHPGCPVRHVPGLRPPALGFVGLADQALAVLDSAALVGASIGAGTRTPGALVVLAGRLAGMALALDAPPWISAPGMSASPPPGTIGFCSRADRAAGGGLHAIIDPDLLGGLLAAARSPESA